MYTIELKKKYNFNLKMDMIFLQIINNYLDHHI